MTTRNSSDTSNTKTKKQGHRSKYLSSTDESHASSSVRFEHGAFPAVPRRRSTAARRQTAVADVVPIRAGSFKDPSSRRSMKPFLAFIQIWATSAFSRAPSVDIDGVCPSISFNSLRLIVGLSTGTRHPRGLARSTKTGFFVAPTTGPWAVLSASGA